MICTTREMLLGPSNEMGGACTYGEEKNAYRVLVRKSEGLGHLEDLSVDGKMILLVKWTLKECN